MDLFKFYIEELKIRYHDQKKIIKDILRDLAFVVEVSTPYEEFHKQLLSDNRSNACDLENMQLVYDNVRKLSGRVCMCCFAVQSPEVAATISPSF